MNNDFTTLKTITKNICKLINISHIFNIELKYEIELTYDQNTYINFYFDEKNYCIFLYYKDYYTNNYLYAICKDVNSTYKNYIGTFLFNIQMLLVCLSNTQQINLDNYTDNPERAAMGIYSILNVDKRNEDRKKFYGKTLKEQLYLSEGKMYLNINSDTKELVFNKFIEIVKKINDIKQYYCNVCIEKNKWNINYYKNTITFIKYIKCYY